MEHETLKQWMSEANLGAQEGTDGFWLVSRSNLEISVAYMADADLVICFAPLLELAGLEDAQRLEVLSQSLSLNGVGNLPSGCALSYEDSGDVIYLLWQQPPEQLDSARFVNAFEDFETAAAQVQEFLRGLPFEEAEVESDSDTQDFMIKV
ncbi:MAG: type III secretion system chaperone [Lentisphaeria bacterium]|nr:type III secretion system chaperone [Lentisphaeria bacterium]